MGLGCQKYDNPLRTKYLARKQRKNRGKTVRNIKRRRCDSPQDSTKRKKMKKKDTTTETEDDALAAEREAVFFIFEFG